MKKTNYFKILISFVLTLSMIFSSTCISSAATKNEVNRVINKTGDYIYKTVKEPAYGNICGEWAMYGLKVAKHKMSDEYLEKYRSSVEAKIKEGYRGEAGILHDKKYTEYSRVVFTYAALGLNPKKVSGYNLVKKLSDYDKVVWQGIMGPVWALRALDEGNYSIQKDDSVKTQATRIKYVEYILKLQLKDGGWSISGDKADPDVTAMTIQALSKYQNDKYLNGTKSGKKVYKSNKDAKKVKNAISKGVNCLSKMQNNDGGFESGGTSNSESCAQVIWALTMIGINPNSDSRFIKNDNTVVDALLGFYDSKSGGFRHVNEETNGYESKVDQMATEQAYYSLSNYRNKFLIDKKKDK